MMMHNQNMESYKSRKDMLNIRSQENNAFIDSKYNGKKAAVRISFREHDGLFSNIIIMMNAAWCYQQYDIVCTGCPRYIIVLFPNMRIESDSESVDIQRPTIDTPFYIGQNPIILASPAFFGMRLALNAMLEPNGIFAPAQHVIEMARMWWEKNLSDATFVVGVHGRAACHYADTSIDLETHTLLLCVEAEEEIRQTQGTKILVSSCNESIVEQIRSYFYEIEDLDIEVSWRRPEGHINYGNVDWGKTQQRLDADIATGALVDSILLSMCDVVVCGSSNVILYSAALRPTMRIRVARHLARVRGL